MRTEDIPAARGLAPRPLERACERAWKSGRGTCEITRPMHGASAYAATGVMIASAARSWTNGRSARGSGPGPTERAGGRLPGRAAAVAQDARAPCLPRRDGPGAPAGTALRDVLGPPGRSPRLPALEPVQDPPDPVERGGRAAG